MQSGPVISFLISHFSIAWKEKILDFEKDDLKLSDYLEMTDVFINYCNSSSRKLASSEEKIVKISKKK